MSPSMFSKHAAACGKTLASRSSERVRCTCGAMRLPFEFRKSCRLRPAAQRHRVLKTGAASDACSSSDASGDLSQELKHIRQWKAVLLCKRNIDPVIGGSCLQFEVESTAEALAKRKSPRLIDASAKGRMQNQLHSSTLIEEALGNNGGLRGNRAQHRPPRNNIARSAVARPTCIRRILPSARRSLIRPQAERGK